MIGNDPNRRTVLYGAGTITITTLAGCTDTDNSNEEEDPNSSGETNDTNTSGEEDTNSSSEEIEPPTAVEEYLSNANLYDGSSQDLTGKNSIEIRVGAGETGLAFDPPAVRASAGTEITWTWTGEGGAHNVVSEPTSGIQSQNESGQHADQEHGHSDSESNSSDQNETEGGHHSDHEDSGEGMLNSGDPKSGSDITYSETISEPGVYLYHCHPHEEAGMKGAIVVPK